MNAMILFLLLCSNQGVPNYPHTEVRCDLIEVNSYWLSPMDQNDTIYADLQIIGKSWSYEHGQYLSVFFRVVKKGDLKTFSVSTSPDGYRVRIYGYTLVAPILIHTRTDHDREKIDRDLLPIKDRPTFKKERTFDWRLPPHEHFFRRQKSD